MRLLSLFPIVPSAALPPAQPRPEPKSAPAPTFVTNKAAVYKTVREDFPCGFVVQTGPSCQLNRGPVSKPTHRKEKSRPLRFTPFQQVTSWNHPVPLKVKISLVETYEHSFSTAKLDGYEVDFFIQKPGEEAKRVGTAITDTHGYATLYYASGSDSETTITYRLRSDLNGAFQVAGKLTRLSSERPAIVVDLDDLQRQSRQVKLDKVVQSIRQEGYQPILLMNSINNAATYERVARELQRLQLPVLYNDVRYSGFHRDHKGFGEAQLEKLKRLKYEEGVPIVGVYSRSVENRDAYRRNEIALFSWGEKITDRKKELQDSFDRFHQAVTRPDFDPEEFLWDGLTESRWQAGNQFQFYFEGERAFQALSSIITDAETFLSIRNASHVINDAHGNRIKRELFERARPDPEKPLKIRMMMDGLLGSFVFFSNPGITWASDQDVETLKGMGVEYVTIPTDHHIDYDESLWGIGTRHHTKFTVADIRGRAIAFGGGRHFSSGSFDERIPPPDQVNLVEKLAGMEKGGFHDLSFTVQGPLVRSIHQSFLDDFEANGGKRIVPSERGRLLDPALYTPAPDLAASTPARFVTHHSYQDQNCLNSLFRLLEDPRSREVTLVNGFIPTEEMYEAMRVAARSGKEVRWIIGSMANIYDWIRDPRFEKLLEAGVKIFLLPERFHTKLYRNDRYTAFGNHNLDSASLRDDEDLTVVPRKSPAGAELDQYIDSLLTRATPLHEGWRRGESLSKILDKAYHLDQPPKEEISPEEKPHTFGEVINHVALKSLDLGETAVSGIAREVASGRVTIPVRATFVALDDKVGGGVDASFGNVGNRYVAAPKQTWRTFFLNQYAFDFGLYFYDQNFMGTARFANRSAPIELHWGDAAPQISWDQYVGLTAAESLDNRFGLRFQSGNHLNLQGERLGARIGMHSGNEFRSPVPLFDPVTLDPVVMKPSSFYFTFDTSLSFEQDRFQYSLGPYAAYAPYSDDLSLGLFGRLKWYHSYPRDEILTVKGSVQREGDETRGLFLLEIPFN